MGTEYSFFGFLGIVSTWPSPNDQFQLLEMTDKMLSRNLHYHPLTLQLMICLNKGYRDKYSVLNNILYSKEFSEIYDPLTMISTILVKYYFLHQNPSRRG